MISLNELAQQIASGKLYEATKCPGSGKEVVEGSGMGPDFPSKGKTKMECSVCGNLVVVNSIPDDKDDGSAPPTLAPVHNR